MRNRTRFFSSPLVLAVAGGAAYGASLALLLAWLADKDTDWGSVAEWTGGVGTLIGVLVAIHVFREESKRNRAHHELSLRPFLWITAINGKPGDTPNITLTLENRGFGPAEVVRWEMRLDGLDLSYGNSVDVPAYIAQRGALGVLLRRSEYRIGAWLQAGYREELASLTRENDVPDQEGIKRVMRAFHLLEVRLVYKSVYGELFTLYYANPPRPDALDALNLRVAFN